MRARSRSSPARPYPIRFMSFTLVIWPSTLPVLQTDSTPAWTAARSAVNVLASRLNEGNWLVEACSIRCSRSCDLPLLRIARNHWTMLWARSSSALASRHLEASSCWLRSRRYGGHSTAHRTFFQAGRLTRATRVSTCILHGCTNAFTSDRDPSHPSALISLKSWDAL